MLSVIIITKNEEKNIERCLQSVLWADEIIVVDDYSTDKTVELCRQFSVTLIQKKWEGYSKQKEFAAQQASYEWILSIDADEEVTEELRREILSVLSSATAYNGYQIPRKSFFLDKWMKYGGWYPGYQLRLFKKSAFRMNHRPVHEGFETNGAVGRLRSNLNHYTYHSIHQYLEKMNDYTSLEVMNKIEKGKRIRWYHLLLNPLSHFLRMFFSLKGYRDGFYGFLLAVYSSLYTLLVFAKSWEFQEANRAKEALPPVTSEELQLLKNLL